VPRVDLRSTITPSLTTKSGFVHHWTRHRLWRLELEQNQARSRVKFAEELFSCVLSHGGTSCKTRLKQESRWARISPSAAICSVNRPLQIRARRSAFTPTPVGHSLPFIGKCSAHSLSTSAAPSMR